MGSVLKDARALWMTRIGCAQGTHWMSVLKTSGGQTQDAQPSHCRRSAVRASQELRRSRGGQLKCLGGLTTHCPSTGLAERSTGTGEDARLTSCSRPSGTARTEGGPAFAAGVQLLDVGVLERQVQRRPTAETGQAERERAWGCIDEGATGVSKYGVLWRCAMKQSRAAYDTRSVWADRSFHHARVAKLHRPLFLAVIFVECATGWSI